VQTGVSNPAADPERLIEAPRTTYTLGEISGGKGQKGQDYLGGGVLDPHLISKKPLLTIIVCSE
jgi:hypothetical protein